VVDRFGDGPLAYLVVEGMSLGQVYHRGLGVKRYRITVDTPGGHSWVDYGRPSAIHVLGEIIHRLSNLSLPRQPRTTLNIGTISGGTSVNTIADHAQLELDLRSESVDVLANLAARVETMVQRARYLDVEVALQVIGQRPAGEIPLDHPLVQMAIQCLQELGIPPRLNIGSTDANIPLSRGYPSICLGLTNGSGAHTKAELIQAAPLATGMQQLVNIVTRIFNSRSLSAQSSQT
jgi:acetylornithine deacetylase/succinyl-diaminopimelate desuccinylase-like protein